MYDFWANYRQMRRKKVRKRKKAGRAPGLDLNYKPFNYDDNKEKPVSWLSMPPPVPPPWLPCPPDDVALRKKCRPLMLSCTGATPKQSN